jgi:hypothetical protein
MAIDAAEAALLGSAIGGITVVLGTIVFAWSAKAREKRAFLRSARAAEVDRLRGVYEYATNVISNLIRGGKPDRVGRGIMLAQLTLFGSPEVQFQVTRLLETPQDQWAGADLADITDVMKAHLAELEAREE